MKGSSVQNEIGSKYVFLSPAKVNLRLKVEGRRSDGYHLLSMLNVTTGICDRLTLSFISEQEVLLKVRGGPAFLEDGPLMDVQRNLASLAAKRFLERFELPLGVSIELDKSIPPGTGLGGGSSNAAAVLRFLMERFKNRIISAVGYSEQQFINIVHDLAVELGADVPYLLYGGLARVSGVGEEVEVLDGSFLEEMPCKIIFPQEPVSTRKIFEDLRRKGRFTQYDKDCEIQKFLEEYKLKDSGRSFVAGGCHSLYERLLELVDNDLSESIRSNHPALGSLLDELAADNEIVPFFTGSGCSIVVLAKQLTSIDKFNKKEFAEIADKHKVQIVSTCLLANLCKTCKL